MHSLLFLCVENACRSQMAEAFARLHMADRLHVFSAGSRPAGQVAPTAIASMRAVGYDLRQHEPKSLHEIPQQTFAAVVTIGPLPIAHPYHAGRNEHWSLPPGEGRDPEAMDALRDEIERRVVRLLQRIDAH